VTARSPAQDIRAEARASTTIARDGSCRSLAPARELADRRFRALLSDEKWAELSPRVRRRFSKRLADGQTAIYIGEIIECRLSWAGWLLIQLLRLIGGPLPTSRDFGVPSIVTVMEDMRSGGQIWTRMYARRHGFPQVIHSAKRFAGRTGLEEYVGFGIGMELTAHVENSALMFRSGGYFLQILDRRFLFPAWAAPGRISIAHAELPEGKFRFTLELVHPRLGMLVRQECIFRDADP
jgi:hypothetical protein